MASSSAKLVPSDPEKVMVIRKITPEIITASTPFLRFGRIKIGGRATLVRLQTGSVAVFSPVALTDSLRKETEDLGTVKYLIAPDVEHHIFLEAWHKAYPEAKVIGPESLPAHREKQGYFNIPQTHWTSFIAPGSKSRPDEPSTAPSSTPISAEFDAEFASEYVHSHINKELVFVHRPTRTLIEADLLFNLPATEQMSKSGQSATSGILTKIFNYLQTTEGAALAQKRFLWYGASSSDRPSFNASMRRINAWDFDRIIPCHGDVIETGGKGIFEKVMGWHLAAQAK